jgi:hypothetical protein
VEGERSTMSIEFLTNDEKFDIVIHRNTFFFNDAKFEEKWEAYTSTITNLLLLLKRRLATEISDEGKKRVVVSFIQDKPEGLTALLALSAISEEFLLRLFTFVRIADDPELNKLVNRRSFPDTTLDREWNKQYLFRLIRTNTAVAEGLVNLLFEGFSVPILTEALPLFELKKLNFNRLDFSTDSLIDSIVRHSKRGSYKGKAANDPAGLIKEWLDSKNISYKRNTKVKNIQRRIDFAIPNEITPKIIIECSYEITTSSGMGDKAKTEMGVAEDIRRYYPNAVFIGFTDGIGWYVRRNDLKKLVSAFNNVFTFKQGEGERFLKYVSNIL